MANNPKRVPVTVLKALLEGHVIEYGPRKWCLDDNYDLCIIGTKQTLHQDKEPVEVLLRVDLELGDFIRHFSNMSEQDFFKLCANITLNACK